MHLFTLVIVTAGLIIGSTPLHAQQVFTVDAVGDAADASPGDGVCGDGAGACTLRAAIQEANAAVGVDTIAFGIAGAGPHAIALGAVLPSVTDPVVVDGYTQPGASPNTNPPTMGTNAVLMIVIDGGSNDVLVVSAGSSTIRGLALVGGADDLIALTTNGGNTIEGCRLTPGPGVAAVRLDSPNNLVGGTSPAARNVMGGGAAGVTVFGGTGNTIQGNLIGTDASGTVAVPHTFAGIEVRAPATTIGGPVGNVIAGSGQGIVIDAAGADDGRILGNLIGTDVTGTVALGNATDGIRVDDGLRHVIEGNVISGNGQRGIVLVDNADSAVVTGNNIGVDRSGMAAMPNGNAGIWYTTSGHTIGGAAPGAGNVIAANAGAGLLINGDQSVIQGNLIGTGASGTVALGNGSGILIDNGSSNTIGGPAAGAANVIAASDGFGISITGLSSGNVIQGNFIGTDAVAGLNLGNGVANGNIGVLIGAQNTTIEGNTIAFSGADGVLINGTGNRVSQNAIFSNAGLGIALGLDGVTPNDGGDADAGPNDLQNFPVLALAYVNGGTTVEGTLNSSGSETFTLEFFASGTCDPTDHGEGAVFLGSTQMTTNASGDAAFIVPLPRAAAVGDVVTATATDAAGNTSEFSRCVRVAAQPGFVVTAADDANDGVCSDGHCSLREAVTAANAWPGTQTIAFDIPGAGPHTIALGGSLPTITDTLVIDGFTQAGAGPNTNPPTAGTNGAYMVVLDATNTGVAGLEIAAGGSTVRGLHIEAAPDYAVGILTNGGNLIEGNLLLPGPNAFGVYVETPDNTIGGSAPAARNVISGGATGIWIQDTGTGNVVQGNLIGTDAAGTAAAGNQFAGLSTGAASTVVGGTDPGAGNVISANGTGVVIRSDATGVLVRGNLIGTDVTGTRALGNQGIGVEINSTASDNTIGGTAAEARNVISGNGQDGVRVLETGVTGNVVQGNYIGTDATGALAIPNAEYGVRLTGNSSASTIGGSAPGAGNLISGNGLGGVFLSGSNDNVVEGNRIGTDAAGTAPLGNTGPGVFIDAVGGNTVGGTSGDAGNVIAFNTQNGVEVESGSGHAILGNAIHDNDGLGIDLASDGITANDAGDGDAGANNRQNFPTIDIALTGSAVLEGAFNGAADATFVLEFFASGACDPTGNGEGERFLGSTMVTTDGAGDATFAVSLAGSAAPGDAVTATATDDQNNTSEFSPCATGVGYATTASPGKVTVARGGAAQYTVTVSAEAGTFDRDVALSCEGLPAGTACAFAPASVQPGAGSAMATLTVTTGPTTPTGANAFTIVGSYSTIERTFDATLTATDFTVSVAPASATAARGGDAAYTVTVDPDGGSFGEAVDLACSGLPAGAACSFAPAQVTPGATAATSTLTISTTNPDTRTGTVTVTVTGTAGTLSHSASADLVVSEFLVAVAPDTVATRRGDVGAFTVTVDPGGGTFDAPVALACSGLPAQAACAFSPDSVTPGASAATASLSVSTADPGTPVGSTEFTVTGTAGSLDVATTTTLTVIDFRLTASPGTVTISGGETASFTVTVEPEGAAFGKAVSLACSGLPAGASCGFAPATVTPGGGLATSTLTVSASGLAAAFRAPGAAIRNAGITWNGSLALLALIAVSAACRATVRRPHTRRWIVAGALGVTLAGLACGGDMMGPDQPVTTTFTITGTSGSLTNTTTATVTVQ